MTILYLEDLVPRMLHPRTWHAWIPEIIWDKIPFNIPIGVAHYDEHGWIIWSKDLTFIWPQNISISKRDPNYQEPYKCGYTIKEDDTPDTPEPRIA